VKTNDQVTRPGYIALSSIYSFVDSNYYSELLTSILNIDCFFNVIMIQTPSVIIFSKIKYDYDTNQIISSYDDTRGYFTNPRTTLTYKGLEITYLGKPISYKNS